MRIKKELKFDYKTNIVSYLWKNDNIEHIGTIEIFHGMAENILRYDEMANYFADQGFIVIGHDHFVHGDSASSIDEIGEVLDYDFMDGIIKAMKLVRDEYDEYFVLGKRYLFAHSMGSMAAQRYIQLFPDDFDKVVLSGTDIGGGKYKIAKAIIKPFTRKNKIVYSNFVLNLTTSGFNKRFKNDHPKYGWLTRNLKNIENYENNKYCGKDFPTNYFYSLSKMMCENVKSKNLKKINPSIKILLYSGKEDPVSNFSKSIIKLEKKYKKFKIDASYKVIDNARHEVHNENDEIKFELYKMLVRFYKN